MKILLIEDNPADILLAREGFKAIDFSGELTVLHDGKMAMQHLNRIRLESRSGNMHALPDLILLDLNLPYIHGLKILEFIKQDGFLHHIPVVILTTSLARSDVEAAFKHRANSYLVKPMDFHEFVDLLDRVVKYWSLESKYTAVA